MFGVILPELWNMSFAASAAIGCVLAMRFLLRKAPKVLSYTLWGIVLFRLLCPVSISSAVSLYGLWDTPVSADGVLASRIEYISTDLVREEAPVVFPEQGMGEAIQDSLPQGEEQRTEEPSGTPIPVVAGIWLAGVLSLALYAAVSYARLRRRLITASRLRENIYLADEIPLPFVMGLFRPNIYLPSFLREEEWDYIILHEQIHIRRRDPLVKGIAFAALCLHWFNPLVWCAFFLACRDMEMSCDEAVVKKMGPGVLADYTASLLSLAAGKHRNVGMPLAFGEGNTKKRIQNLAGWKKPAFWTAGIAAAACVILAVGLLVNPDVRLSSELFGHSYSVSEIEYLAEPCAFGSGDETAARYRMTDDFELLVSREGSSVWRKVNGKFEKEYLSPLIFNDYFKDHAGYSGWIGTVGGPDRILNDIEQAWRLAVKGDENGAFFDLIRTNHGEIYLCSGYDVGESYPAEEDSFMCWLLRLEAEKDTGADRDLISGTCYISERCFYMNPLSSYAALCGDSGCTYRIGEDAVEIVTRSTGAQKRIDVPRWEWEEFPYTAQAWAELFPIGAHAASRLPERYDELFFQSFTDRQFLLWADGELLLVELSYTPQGQAYVWSIYSLVPEHV